MVPIVGGRTIAHLQANVEALGLDLSRDDIDELEGAAPFDLGFPLNLVQTMGGKVRDVSGEPSAIDGFGNAMFVRLDEPELVQPIRPGHKAPTKP